jgi:hypothetical protein
MRALTAWAIWAAGDRMVDLGWWLMALARRVRRIAR